MVLFLISNYTGFNTGHGGHYYSLRQMAETMAKYKEVTTIVVGSEMPIALIGMDSLYYISTDLNLQRKGLKKTLSTLEEFDFLSRLSVVHAYDARSVYIGASIAKIAKVGFFLTKCGGRIPSRSYPKVNNLIVFQEADYNYFCNYKGHYKHVYLIPNRVKGTVYCKNRSQQLDNIKEKELFNFLKIGRISNYYYKTLADTIRFCSKLPKSSYPISLVFIGYEQSTNITEKLKALAQELSVNLSIYTDSTYTSNASELIWACDVAIGTGRGAMEALSAGKILLFPVANFDYPCLFNEETAPHAMYDNFSERVVLPEELSKYCDPKYVMDSISDSLYAHDLKKFGMNIFNSRFNVDVGAKKLITIYTENNTVNTINKYNLLKLEFNSIKDYFKYRIKKLIA